MDNPSLDVQVDDNASEGDEEDRDHKIKSNRKARNKSRIKLLNHLKDNYKGETAIGTLSLLYRINEFFKRKKEKEQFIKNIKEGQEIIGNITRLEKTSVNSQIINTAEVNVSANVSVLNEAKVEAKIGICLFL